MKAALLGILLTSFCVPLADAQTPSSPSATAPTSRPGDSNWPQFRGDNRLSGVAQTSRPADLKLLWRFDTAPARAQLARARPAMIPASQAATGPEPIESTAAIFGGLCVFGCSDGLLYAVSMSDGKLQWAYAASGPITASPAIARDFVLFGDESGTFHAVRRSDGAAAWTFKTGAEVHSSATVIDETVVFGSYDGMLYCLHIADGSLAWKYDAGDKLHGTPAVWGDAVLAAGCDARLHVVRRADGSALRTIPLGSVCGVGAANDGAAAILGTHGGTVVGVDLDAGRVRWRFADPQREFPFMSSAAIFDGKAVLGGRDKRIRALNLADGTVAWTFVAGGRVDSSPVVWDGWAMIGSTDGVLYAIDVHSGRKVWSYETGSAISASPAIVAGALVVGTADGFLLCFGAPR